MDYVKNPQSSTIFDQIKKQRSPNQHSPGYYDDKFVYLIYM